MIIPEGHSRVINDIRAQLDASFLSEKALAFPTHYYVAVSVLCDLRCPYCPRQFYKDDIDHGLMDFAAFKRVAPYLGYANYAGFFGLGEPFLNPRFLDFLVLGKSYGAYVATSTHGMSLMPEVAEKLVAMCMDEIAVSIDGPNRRVFEFLREGANFDQVLNNVRHLNSLKRKKKTNKPAVFIAVVVSVHNVKYLPAMVKLAKELEAERVVVTDLIIVDKKNVGLSVYGTRQFERALRKAKKLGDQLDIEVVYFHQNPFPWKPLEPSPAPVEGVRFGCHEAWRSYIIEKNGDMKPCCYIDDVFGNCFEQSFSDILNNEKIAALRRSLMQGQPIPCCANCGNLVRVTDAYVGQVLNETQRMIENASLEAGDRNELAGLVRHYQGLRAKAFGEKSAA
jgi:MoaA/NifB/PqqE/SkfB family radical SAM enzyme